MLRSQALMTGVLTSCPEAPAEWGKVRAPGKGTVGHNQSLWLHVSAWPLAQTRGDEGRLGLCPSPDTGAVLLFSSSFLTATPSP